MEKPLIVYSTFPDTETARRVGREVVEARLAACVNILPGMESVYVWQAEVESASEVVAIFKTRSGLREEIGAAIKEKHPYETPEVIFLATEGAEAGTFAWLLNETGAGGGR